MDQFGNFSESREIESNKTVSKKQSIYSLAIDYASTIPDIKEKLDWFYTIHGFLFGIIFLLIAIYAIKSIIHIRSQISRKRFMSGINTFICILGVSRAASLIIDPYGARRIYNKAMARVIWAIGFPSLTCAFCLLQLAFLHLTKLKIGSRIIRSEILLRIIITLHIFISVLKAVITSLSFTQNILIIDYAFEFIFHCWSIFIYGSFLYIGRKVFARLNRLPMTVLDDNSGQPKGIMQLVMLAPSNNLATSVTAALVPTLLRPAFTNMRNNPTNTTTTGRGVPARNAAVQNTKPSVPSPVGFPRIDQGNSTQSRRIIATKRNLNPKCDTDLNIGNINKEDHTSPGLTDMTGKMKRLTWQSSIAKDGKTDPDLITKAKPIVRQKPILKETKKNDNEEIKTDTKVDDSIKLKNNNNKTMEKNLDVEEGDNNDQGETENDMLLHSILNHIAYNRASNTENDLTRPGATTPKSRKQQVRSVLKITYSAAVSGLVLTFLQMIYTFGPYGIFYSLEDNLTNPRTWLIHQSICRAIEVFISVAIASVTKQPSAQRYYAPSVMFKQRQAMFM